MSIPNELVGRIGQKIVETWAAQAKMTANPPAHDERGWDLFVQLAGDDVAPSGPLDRAPPELSCMIQVKTTTTADTSCAIALSNWQRMVKEPIPWFVLAIHVDADGQPTDAYLLHIDETWCARVLKRLRELCSESAPPPLNRRTLEAQWTDADRITPLHGRTLAERIRASVGSQHDYVTGKIAWFNTIGYEDPRRHIDLNFTTTDSDLLFRELADLGVGARTTLPGEWRAVVSDVRFGIRGQLDEFGKEAGEMEFRASPGGRIRFAIENVSGRRSVELVSDLYRALATFPFLPPKYDKFRIVSIDPLCPVTCVLSSPDGKGTMVELRVSLPSTPLPLRSFRKVSDLVLIAADHENDQQIFRISSPEQDPSSATRVLEKSRLAQLPSEHVTRAQIVERALHIASEFGIADDATATFSRLLDQEPTIAALRQMMSPESGEATATYSRNIAVGDRCGLVVDAVLYLEKMVLVATFGIHGVASVVEKHPTMDLYRVTMHDGMSILDKNVVPQSEIESFDVDGAHRRMADRLTQLGCAAITHYSVADEVDE
jgi:hypothetical protein